MRHRRRMRKLLVESLEDRRVLTTVAWDGGGGDLFWSNPLNWSGDQLPGIENDVVIDAPGNVTIQFDVVEPQAIKSLDLKDSLRLSAGSLTVAGSMLVSPDQRISAQGAAFRATDGVAELAGVSLVVSNGGSIVINTAPVVTNSTANFRDMLWEVRGAGSILSLPTLTRLNNGGGYDQDVFLHALDGGTLNLSSVTQLMDEYSGDDRRSSIQALADGADSRIDLSSLHTMLDGYASGPGSADDGEFSRLSMSGQGVIELDSANSLTGVFVQLNGGPADLTLLATLTRGRLDVSNQNIALDNLTNLDATSVFVSGGSTLEFPALTSYSHASFGNHLHTSLRATGPGSVLDMPFVTTVTGGSHYNSRLAIEALDGALVNLPAVTAINDPSFGDSRWRRIDVLADGLTSQISLTSLIEFVDVFGTAGTGDGLWSSIRSRNGGNVTADGLLYVEGTQLLLDGAGEVPYASVKSFRSGQLSISDPGPYQFPELQEMIGTQINILSGEPSFPAVWNIDNASVHVEGSAVASFPLVSQYYHASTGNHEHRFLRAVGEGSRLELANLLIITNGTHYDSRLVIEALNGAAINLSGAVEVTAPNAGDSRWRRIDVAADGSGSRVDFSSLTYFRDQWGTSDSGDSIWSTLSARNGGEIIAPSLKHLTGTDLQVNAAGVLPYQSLETVHGGRIFVTGEGSFEFPNLISVVSSNITVINQNPLFPALKNIDGSSLLVSDAGTLALPGVTNYSHASGDNNQYRTFRATGVGSVLDLGNVTNIGGGTHYGSRLAIEALSGGVVDLSAVVHMSDPGSGDGRWRRIDVWSDGAGSRVDLTNLQSFSDQWGNSSWGDDIWSTLNATNGAVLDIPNLKTLHAVSLALGSSGIADVDQLTTMSWGSLPISGSARSFPALTSIFGTSVVVDSVAATFPVLTSLRAGTLTLANGGTANLDAVTNIDGQSLLVSGGVTLALPGVTNYSHASGDNNQHRTFRATGVGSVLDLGNVTNITGGTHYNSRLAIEALSGGVLNLSKVTQINDPGSGDTRWRRIDVFADGAGSQIDLSQLVNFIDVFGTASSGDSIWSSLVGANGGRVQAERLTVVRGVNVVTGESRISTASEIPSNVEVKDETDLSDHDQGFILLGDDSVLVTSGDSFGSVYWIGGSGNWETSSNWSTGRLPGPRNRVFIDSPQHISITINSNVRVESIHSTEDVSLISGSLVVTSASVVSGNLLLRSGTSLTADGFYAAFEASGPTVLDGASLYATRGGKVRLPSVSAYSHASGDNNQHRTFRATGVGSVLDLGNVSTMSGGTHYNSRLAIEAIYGGTIDLSATTRIEDPDSGDFRWRRIDITSDGAYSSIDLSSLASFSDRFGSSSSGDAIWSTLAAIDSGNVSLSQAVFTGVHMTTGVNAQFFGEADLSTNSRLTGNGTAGAVGNAGTVAPNGFLTLTSDYRQQSQGRLIVRVGGTAAGNNFDRLVVNGNAVVHGILELVRTNNFVPTLGSEFKILAANTVTGVFNNVVGAAFGNNIKLQPEVRADGVYLVAVADLGPKIIGTNPQSEARHALSSIDVSFDEPILWSSVNAEQFALNGPAGVVAVANLTQPTPSSIRIHFAPQTQPGNYSLQVGPNIRDLAGNAMDQNGNGTGGETADVYSTNIELLVPAEPVILSQSPSGLINTAPQSITLQFSVPLDPTSARASSNSVLIHLGSNQVQGGGDDQQFAVTPEYVDGSLTLTLTPSSFPQGLPAGHYRLQIRSGEAGVRNVVGGQLDGNDDGVPGDDYFGNFSVNTVAAAASIVLSQESDSGISNSDRLTNQSNPTFVVNVNQIGLLEFDPLGNGAFTQSTYASLPGQFSFTHQYTSDGAYSPVVRFRPAYGSLRTSSTTFTLDRVAPDLLSGVGSEQAPVFSQTVRFSEPITTSDGSTTPGSLSAVLIGPGGEEINIRGVNGSGANYTFTFDPVFVPGTYELRFTDQIFDVAGNQILSAPMDSFLVLPDVTAPFVTAFIPLGPTNQNINSLRITFSEPMDLATLTAVQVSIQTPLGVEPVLVSSIARVPGSDEQFEIVLASSISVPGDYMVTIAESVADLSGNTLGAAYSAGITIDKTGPRIVSAVPVGTLHQVISFIDVTFDSQINEATFSNNDVSLLGPTGVVSRANAHFEIDRQYG